jgi:hypothetical protein
MMVDAETSTDHSTTTDGGKTTDKADFPQCSLTDEQINALFSPKLEEFKRQLQKLSPEQP